MKRALLLMAFCLPALAVAQDQPPASSGTPPIEALIGNLPARNVGPTTMGGRVTDLAVYEKEPRIFYVGTASGGVWKTTNGGITMTPVFHKEGTSSAGAVAVSQKDPNLVWVGTGEATSRNSSIYGDGIYKSTDGGQTWTHMGLNDCTHFSKVVIDPRNDDTVYAAGMGHLWGYNEERGVYKTTDGGKTWNKVFYVDDKTGMVDMVMDPKNPNTLMVAAWEKLRYPWNFVSGGPGSGLYKTTNGGRNWKKITKGLPTATIGRMGISYFRKDPKILVLSVERGNRNEETGVYRSTDGGESWTRVNAINPRPFYFSMPRYDPSDVDRIYLPAVSLHFSSDQGKTFGTMPTSVHVDHHAMWINPSDSNHMIIGEDGGVGQTRDRGATWEHLNYMPIGQFYAIAFDMRKPYWVYGGLQDNGTWGSPTQTTRGGVAFYDAYTFVGGDGFHVQADPNDWTIVYGESQGGALSRVDLKYGARSRSVRPRPQNTTPAPAQGERWRFNWSSPIVLSPHNSKIIYFGGNKLFKSLNQGDTWQVISPDLTTNDIDKQRPGEGSVTPENTGAEVHCTIITISESPRQAGVIWVGTDDGQVQVTRDGGTTWEKVNGRMPDLPVNAWCSRVTASKYVDGRCYATFDDHRRNNYKTHVYVTEDFGQTWSKLNGNLPENEPCHVIKEGEQNPNLLFLGTEKGLWISLDRGQSWGRYFAGDFPTVPVHDVAVHPRDKDLVIGTHGRSIWILPIGPLEELTAENLAKAVVLTKPAPVYDFGRVNGGQWEGDRTYVSRNTQPGALIGYYLKADATGDAQVTITDIEGRQVAQLRGGNKAGLNVVRWNASTRGRTTPAGSYRVTLTLDGKEYVTSVDVEDVADLQDAPQHLIDRAGRG